MFGFTEAQLQRALLTPPPVRPWVAVLMLLPCVAVVLVVTALDLLSRPAGVQAILDRAFAPTPFRMGLDDIELLPLGTNDPRTWQFAVAGLDFRPVDPTKPDWRAERARIAVPEVLRGDEGLVLHFPFLDVAGLAIRAHKQRPPPPWKPKPGVVAVLLVDRVHLSGASYYAAPDPPLGMARAKQIRGTLTELSWRPGPREVSAQGAVMVDEFTTGAITVHDVALDPFTLDRSSLHFAGDFSFGSSRGSLSGDIETFHIKSAVTLDVDLPDASVGNIIKTATGTPGPVDGVLDLDLVVYAGGDRPRGASLLDGTVKLREGTIQLGRDTRYIFLDLIRIAPWVKLDAYNRVLLDDMHGRVRFTRGQAQLRGLSYPAGKRELRVDGTIQANLLHLLVRLTPPPRRPDGPGIGILLYGTPQQQRFRFATRDDLARDEPWEPILKLEGDLPEVFPRQP